MKKICLIYTGGTIGMVKSEQGYVPDSARFAAELAAANRLVISSLVPAAVQRTKALLNAESEAVQLAAAKDILDRAGYKPQDNIKLNADITSEKLADVFRQIGGEGLEE